MWTMHVADPTPDNGAAVIKVAGCKVIVPPRPALSYWRALEAGDVKRVEELFSGGEDVNQLGGAYGSTALGWAALAADEEMLKLCIKQGADVSLKARKGSAPLHMAVWNGDHPSIVQALIDAGADVTVTNHEGKTPLEVARWFDTLETQSAAPQIFNLDEWRETWGVPPAGRKRVIAILAAAVGEEAEAEAANGAEKEEAEEGPRGRRGRVEKEDDDDEETGAGGDDAPMAEEDVKEE